MRFQTLKEEKMRGLETKIWEGEDEESRKEWSRLQALLFSSSSLFLANLGFLSFSIDGG